MHNLIKQIPNFITILNLIAGFIAIILSFDIDFMSVAPYFILAAAVFDVCDGLFAKLLNSSSVFGKELDSLADAIAFGVAPGIMLFNLLKMSLVEHNKVFNFLSVSSIELITLSTSVLIPVFAVIRLARFNTDDTQKYSFKGLPVPASAILIASICLIFLEKNVSWIHSMILSHYFLIGLIAVLSFLMVSDIPMFSLKMSKFSFKENPFIGSFILFSLLLLIFLKVYGIPLIIISYILISVFRMIFKFDQWNVK